MIPSGAGCGGRDEEFARVALPLLPRIARLAGLLTRDPGDAEDLVQDTFLKAYRHWDTFIPGSDCRRWLATICRNTFYAQQARRRWVVAVGDDLELETFAAVQLHELARERGVEEMFARLDLAPAIRAAIDALPAEFRESVLLVDVEDLRYDDAARLLGIPVGTVRSRLYRGRRLLQQALITYAVDAGFTVTAASPPTLAPPRAAGVTHARP
jgi:RNA polymerase sigma-70 factor (ECF subfamily)